MDDKSLREMIDRVIQKADERMALETSDSFETVSFETVRAGLEELKQLILQNGRELTAIGEDIKQLLKRRQR